MNETYSQYEYEVLNKLDYLIELLRDIRVGVSLALGEDLTSYHEDGKSVDEE